MKIYRFGYIEFAHNYMTVDIELDDDYDPKTYADSFRDLIDHVNWEKNIKITSESDITFYEISPEQE